MDSIELFRTGKRKQLTGEEPRKIVTGLSWLMMWAYPSSAGMYCNLYTHMYRVPPLLCGRHRSWTVVGLALIRNINLTRVHED